MGVTQTSEVSSFRRRMKHDAMPLSLLRRSGAGSGCGMPRPRRAITARAVSRRCALPVSMCTRSSTRCSPNNDTLRKLARHALNRDPAPSISVLDTQSVKTTEADGECSFDGRNKVNGRKQQCRVDTNGFLGRTLVHPAYIQGILSQSRIERSLSLSWFYRNCS